LTDTGEDGNLLENVANLAKEENKVEQDRVTIQNHNMEVKTV